ncbi:WbqC family protein [Aquirufa sp. ROCK-SH2]
MSVAIMQPYFFPYLGYFQLIQAVDDFVFYDDVMFIKKGWINRNQILMQNQAFLFTIPLVKQSQNKTIRETSVSYGIDFPGKFLTQITAAYKKAPHYSEVFKLIEDVLKDQPESMADLAIRSIELTCNYLGLEKRFHQSSDLGISNPDWEKADRLIAITKSLGSDHYINAKNGEMLYNKAYFLEQSCRLNFLNPTLPNYPQGLKKGVDFIPGLSIIDLMMWNNSTELKNMLLEYHLF